MFLQSSEAAEALNVDEKTVLRWIRDDRLPAELVQGHYRSDPADLLLWATERGLKVDPLLYAMPAESRPLPTLSQALEAGGIHRGVAGADKESALRSVVELLEIGPELEPEFLLQELLLREAMGSTSVGDGIAIPHARNPVLLRLPAAKVSLSYLAQPLDFGALDRKPVRILFSMLTPDVRTHLHLLSQLAFCLARPGLRQMLEGEGDPERILAAFREIEGEIVRP